MPTYLALLGIHSIILFGAQLRMRERQSLELQAKLTQSRLDTLKLQLQPHFLFNTLNAISTLLHREPKTADSMIGDLSTLLRGVLEERGSNEIALSRELALLGAYVSIERMRFSDRLSYEQQIAPECLPARVPTLLLQPIVENAVRYGIEPLGSPATITLAAKKQGDRLILCVADDGLGRAQEQGSGMGIGLSNAAARLDAMFGAGGYSLKMDHKEGGGTTVTTDLPFHTTAA